MRHLRSILYALVLAPAAWVLTGAGLTGELSARGRDGFAVEAVTGLLLLVLAGTAYGILVLGPISPAGPLAAGVVLLAIAVWAMIAPAAYAAVWPAGLAKEGFDLSRPGYGLAALLAVPLICTALSARRWERYEPPVLPMVGPIGRFRAAASAPGTPIAAIETTVMGLPGASRPSDDTTTVLRGFAVLPPGEDAPPVADHELTTAFPDDEPLALLADEEPTETLEAAESVRGLEAAKPAEVRARVESAEALAGRERADVLAAVAAEADVEATVAAAREGSAAEGPTEGLPDVPDSEGDDGEKPQVVRLPVADEGERTQNLRLPVGDADERTQNLRLPVGDADERTQVVRLPVADAAEKTQVVRFPSAGDEWTQPLAPSGETTQVLRPAGRPDGDLPLGMGAGRRDRSVGPGDRLRDLRNRFTGDLGGDETQVIRLPGATVADEHTQVIRPGLVLPPGERTQPLESGGSDRSEPPVSIAGAERPDFAKDPTSRIVPPGARQDDEDSERSMTVMKMERPPDERTGNGSSDPDIPKQRRSAEED